MAIAEITIIPIGTADTSLSQYVADIHRILQQSSSIRYELTPMSTIIEGELDVLFSVIRQLHEVPFASGVKRVSTSIKIDDRRDKESTMQSKLQAVQEKIGNPPGGRA